LLLSKGYGADLQGSTLGEILDSGRIRVIHDLERYLASKPQSQSTKILIKEGVRSSLTGPLMVEGRRVGFLFRSSRETEAYSTREVALHAAIAERLSQAVEKAWRIEQLEEANRSYMEMLGFVSHELKSPVASIITQGKLLRDGLWGDLDEKQQEIVDRIVTRSEYLLNLTREYLDLARFEGGGATLNNLAREMDFVAEVATPAAEVIQPQMAEKGTQFEEAWPKEGVHLDGDATLLKVVMVNLIGNAVKYGNEGGRVKVSAQRVQDKWLIEVWNEGPGFPEEMKGKLFRRFSRLPKKELMSRKGSGVGLYVTWQIVQKHHGRIFANSKEGEWAKFSVELPLAQPEDEKQG